MISVFADLEQLSRAAAAFIAQLADDATEKHGRFTIALAGGGTPKRTYELLAEPPLRDQVPWANVHVFWGDERCVPPGDSRSNQRMAREALLDHVPIPDRQIHPVEFSTSPAGSAGSYEQCLREILGKAPRLDLVLLGLGENGHTASLFPHSDVLAEQTSWVGHLYVHEQDLHRVTMTAPLINRARNVLFLVSGGQKARTLRAVLQGEYEPEELPAQLIKPVYGELRWYVDEAAAAQLKETAPKS